MDFVIIPILIFFAFTIKNNYAVLDVELKRLLDQLLVYHIVMSVVFYLYISNLGGDAWMYWNAVKGQDFSNIYNSALITNFEPSTILWMINYIPSNILNLSFFTGCILYAVLGYWGILYIVVILKEQFPLFFYLKKYKFYGIKLFPLVLFLPNLHFWSAGVGKDTLIFYSVCLFFYIVSNLNKRWPLIIISAIICYFIRPHILLFLLAGFAMAYIIRSRISIIQKIFLVIIAAIFFIPLLNNVLEFANIQEVSLESYQQFGSNKSELLNQDAGSGIEISSLPYPLQVLTFLYRPLFFDANNILAMLASIENVLWIILSLLFFKNKPLRIFRTNHFIVFAAFLYWAIGALAFAPVLGNLGIIIRERNMFLPGFIIFTIAAIYNSEKFNKFKFYLYQQSINTKKKNT